MRFSQNLYLVLRVSLCGFVFIGLKQLLHIYMDRVKRIWYLSPMRAAKVQASLRIRAVSPEPSLLAHTSSESRGTFRQKARSLAPLNGWACAVKVCHDGCSKTQIRLTGLICAIKAPASKWRGTFLPKSCHPFTLIHDFLIWVEHYGQMNSAHVLCLYTIHQLVFLDIVFILLILFAFQNQRISDIEAFTWGDCSIRQRAFFNRTGFWKSCLFRWTWLPRWHYKKWYLCC